VNKYRIIQSDLDREIIIPVKIEFDLTGQEDAIKDYENDVVQEIINPIKDFEVVRFTHDETNLTTQKTDVNYNFFFYDQSTNITNTNFSNENLWVNSYNFTTNPTYTGESFTNNEIYYTANSFRRSFFKLDFYDSQNSTNQKLYFTIVIPTQQGYTIPQNIGTTLVPNIVDIKIPKFKLDFVGDKEGFFIYVPKNEETINRSTFYMSVKFFNAKTGEFIRMINKPQSLIASKFNFKKEEIFYYKMILQYENFTYKIFNSSDQRVGDENNPINWYQYINP
jgi:hypothetical protein